MPGSKAGRSPRATSAFTRQEAARLNVSFWESTPQKLGTNAPMTIQIKMRLASRST